MWLEPVPMHVELTYVLQNFQWQRENNKSLSCLSCKTFEHFALQVDPVIEFIQLGSTQFKDSAILVPKLADPPIWWKSNSTPSKSGSSSPDLDRLTCLYYLKMFI